MPSPTTPSFRVYTPLPTVAWKNDWTKQEVDDALQSHELGQFMQSAVLADAMTRDDAFDAVLSTRVLGLLGLPRNVEPSLETDPRKARKIARLVDEKFDQIFPRSTLAELLKWGIVLGFALAQIVWRPSDDGLEWLPELQVWHPSFVYYRFDLRRFVVLTSEGPVVVEPGTGQWLLYTPFGSDRAWMSGAIRSVAIPWLARSFAWRDWQRWCELYSLGVRKAIAPAGADEEDKDRFFGEVASLGSETTVLLTESPTGEKYDVDLLWPNATGSADGFERLMNKCEARIAIRLLGQNLTTEVRSGSLAAARVHENVKLDIIQADDRTLSEDLRAQVLRPYCRFNFPGGDVLAPRIGRKTAPTEDRKNEADTLSGAASALAALITAGVPVDLRAYASRFGVPLLPAENADEADDTATPPIPTPPQPLPDRRKPS
ncbi:MAG: phage portal protein family protein [Polyangiales bacterium]